MAELIKNNAEIKNTTVASTGVSAPSANRNFEAKLQSTFGSLATAITKGVESPFVKNIKELVG